MTTPERDDAGATREFSRHLAPAPVWACIELVLALAVIVAGLQVQHVVFMLGSTPWLVVLGAFFLRWRGPGWRAIGLRRPLSVMRTVAVGVLVGVCYQFFGTYVVEPLIARWTSGALPDVSQFRSLVGDERQLVFWLGISWTLAALLEEVAFRGWLVTRLAEVGQFGRNWWIAGVVATSVLFGAVHAYQGLSGMVATGLTSLVFGGLYLATNRNLWACVVAHGMLDSTGFVMMYFGVYPGL